MQRVLLSQEKYRKAFACMLGDPCPQTNDGCPMWREQLETEANGDQRIVAGCAPQMDAHNLRHLLAAADKPGAEMEALRREINEAAQAALDVQRQEIALLEQRSGERVIEGVATVTRD